MHEYDGQKREEKKWRLLAPVPLLIGSIVIFIVGLLYVIHYGSVDVVTILIKEKEREVKSSKEGVKSKYIVHAEGESFECTDTIWHMKFNSTDVYRELEVGKKFTVKVNKWRIPLFSWYRNILYIKKEVK